MASRRTAALVASLLIGVTTPGAYATETHVLAQAGTSCTSVIPLVKDDTQNPPEWVDPSSLSFALDDVALQDLPQALGPVPAGPAYLIGASQVSGVPWLGVNTMHPSLLNNTEGDVTWELTSFSGPGSMYVFTQGGMGQIVGEEWFVGEGNSASGTAVVKRNSHVHPNWLFSAPGTYQVELTQTVQLLDGSTGTGSATLTFEVGTGAGSATDGHYDFGPTISSDDGQTCGESSDSDAETAPAAGESETTQSEKKQGQSLSQGANQGANQGQSQGQSKQAAAKQQEIKQQKQLPNTGTTVMTLPITILALGVLVFGAGLIFTGRHFRWF